MSKSSRRKFIVGAGAGVLSLSSIDLFTSAFLQGLVESVQAQSMEPNEKIFLNFWLGGGIARWMWDLPLRPNGISDYYVQNIMMKNCLVNNNGKTELDFKLDKHGDYYINPFWQGDVPSSSGGLRPAKELLDNMLIIRGISALSDGHRQNTKYVNRPGSCRFSLSGMASDHGNSFLPAIQTKGADFGHLAPSGTSILNLEVGPDVLSKMFSAFKGIRANSDFASSMLHSKIDELLKHIASQRNTKEKNSLELLLKDKEKTVKLFDQQFGDLTAVYDTLFQKYKNLITRSFNESSIPGIDDITIHPENHTRFNVDYKIPVDCTLNSGINTETHVDSMAHSFAIAEYCIANSITNSLTLECGAIYNITYANHYPKGKTEKAGPFTKRIVLDSHFLGSLSTVYFMGIYLKAYTACILEMKDFLKANNKWDKTVIYNSSEFGRNPRREESGSDHGWRGSSESIVSGMIPSLQIMGNIKADPPDHKTGGGHWGVAANVSELNNRPINRGNVSSTICTMLNIPLIAKNDQSLVSMVNGKTNPLLGRPVNKKADDD